MPFHSLLLCRDNAAVQFLTRGFKEFNVDVESCSDPERALDRLSHQRFEAIVVDTEDRAGAMLLLDGLRPLKSCKNSLRIVLADHDTALGAAFSTGTHLVIYKPIAPDRLRNSLRALCNLMGRRPPREFDRVELRVPAVLHMSDRNVPASLLDISAGGVALSTKQAIPKAQSLGLQFMLPGRTAKITTSAEVVWNDVHGRIGAQFVNMEPGTRKLVCEWIAAQLSSRRLNRVAISKSQA
jgi:DNA-binding response OmpR family regulator